VEVGAEVLNSDNSSLAMNTALSTINNEFEHDVVVEAARLPRVYPICQWKDNRVHGNKYSFRSLLGTMFQVHQIWAIWLIVRRWIWELDMPGALVADAMCLGKMLTLVAVALLCKLLTDNNVLGLPQSILWVNTVEELISMVQNDNSGINGDEHKRYLLPRPNSMPHRILEI
jgi:hypothetical protein